MIPKCLHLIICDLNPGADAPVCSRSASEKSSASCSSGSQVKKANLARPFISTRLEQWNYLDRVSNVGVRDRTLQLVLARLLDVEDPELSRALSRLENILTPSMVAEEDPLARRKQELLLNNVSIGGRLQLIVRARRALILHSTYFMSYYL